MNTAAADHANPFCPACWIKNSIHAAVVCWSLASTGQTLGAAPPPITQSGLNTQVSQPIMLQSGQTQYNITGGTRPGGGANLFHSFGNFNVPTNNIANFLNDSGLPTSNILGRVTGGNPSTIFGMIQTTGFGNANLFLMNPAGFLFGPNATLNVGGMVAFTTADYLRLADGARFNAVPNAVSDALLSPAPVAAFGFLGSNPAAIAIQGSTLQVAPGQSISLVGGNQGFIATDPDTGNPIPVPGGVTMTGGKLLAPSGQINVASVAGPGEISAADFMPAAGMTLGNVSLSQGALLDVSGNAAGTVRIRGGQLTIDNATLAANTVDANSAPTAIDINVTGAVSLSSANLSVLTATTSGTGNAGDIVISSGSLDARFSTNSLFVPLIDSHSTGTGHGGNVTITTGALTVTGDPFAPGAFIASGTAGDGNGGNVTITAGDAKFSNTDIDTGANIFNGGGSGGNLSIKTRSLLLDVVSFGTDALGATAGTIDLETTGLMQMNNSFVSNTSLLGQNPVTVKADQLTLNNTSILSGTAFGNGGDFNISARIVELTNGGILGTQTFGDGNAGNVHIDASERVTINGTTGINPPSGIFTSSLGDPDLGFHGNAGNIAINTPRLELSNGAQINSTTFSSAGRGGDVLINASSVSIAGERSLGSGTLFFMTGGTRASGIYTKTLGSDLCSASCGNGGNISITTGSLTLQNGGLLDSGSSNTGAGGNITVSATGRVLLSGTMQDGTPGGIFSQSTGSDPGSGNGGNILVQAKSVSIQSGAQISASSLGRGNAGTVTVQGLDGPADSFLVDGANSGLFSTTSDVGTGGNININANAVTLQNGAHVSSSSTGTGVAGDITISAGNQFSMTSSSVTTEALHSSGGAIKITTNPNGTVQLVDSTISASVLDGTGGGGSVSIDPQYVLLQNNSQILANAVFGAGGNIFITTNLLLADPSSVISASSAFGQPGTITVQSPVSPASGKIIPLGQKPLLSNLMVNQRCAALAGGNFSSFTIAGRDSLPAEPGSWMSSPLALANVSEIKAPEATEYSALLSLRQVAPAGFLTQVFAVDSSGCQS
ncbi:MAG TPA: filamentous hemagglutinin N-terminal domain-containing protein [Nitrospira sp.]|nr:filamentous hemagglutinin N-terminal domain-containing protein [Nitrospira sp.]